MRPAGAIVDAMQRGLGPNGDALLSAHLDRASEGLVRLINQEHRKVATRPNYEQVVDVIPFGPPRQGRAETSTDRFSTFRKGVGFGYSKSLYAQDWFDSSTERDVANALEDENDITCWVRLQTGDLPILWTTGRNCNPDFIAIDNAGTHWIIEAKMDREMGSDEVRDKREAARRWANHVNADGSAGAKWAYLLLSETDVRTARGSWEAMKGLGGA